MNGFGRHGLLALLILAGIFVPVLAVEAQIAIVPCGGPGQEQCTITDLIDLVIRIYNFLLSLAGFAALIFIIKGALGMLYWGFLENSSSELENAKYSVRRAIAGLVVIMAAYLIVNTLIFLLTGASGVNEFISFILPL